MRENDVTLGIPKTSNNVLCERDVMLYHVSAYSGTSGIPILNIKKVLNG